VHGDLVAAGEDRLEAGFPVLVLDRPEQKLIGVSVECTQLDVAALSDGARDIALESDPQHVPARELEARFGDLGR
jgi:hypothetical protein